MEGKSVMDERLRFVIRLKDGESMAALCREFQISRVKPATRSLIGTDWSKSYSCSPVPI